MSSTRIVGRCLAGSSSRTGPPLLHFRHLLERHGLGKVLFESQNEVFDQRGWITRGGNIVDATMLAAPSLPGPRKTPRARRIPSDEGALDLSKQDEASTFNGRSRLSAADAGSDVAVEVKGFQPDGSAGWRVLACGERPRDLLGRGAG